MVFIGLSYVVQTEICVNLIELTRDCKQPLIKKMQNGCRCLFMLFHDDVAKALVTMKSNNY